VKFCYVRRLFVSLKERFPGWWTERESFKSCLLDLWILFHYNTKQMMSRVKISDRSFQVRNQRHSWDCNYRSTHGWQKLDYQWDTQGQSNAAPGFKTFLRPSTLQLRKIKFLKLLSQLIALNFLALAEIVTGVTFLKTVLFILLHNMFRWLPMNGNNMNKGSSDIVFI
jgi:hypothetical protein